MKKKDKRLSACMAIQNNENGTTVVSMLLTLLVIVIILPFIVHFFSYIQPAKISTDLSVQQFYIFLRNDTLLANRVYSEENKLYFNLTSGEIAKIEQLGNVILRQIDDKGHEIYLRKVDSFTLQPLSYGTKVMIKTEEGVTYEKTIAHYE